jgi:hypothetical protein
VLADVQAHHLAHHLEAEVWAVLGVLEGFQLLRVEPALEDAEVLARGAA